MSAVKKKPECCDGSGGNAPNPPADSYKPNGVPADARLTMVKFSDVVPMVGHSAMQNVNGEWPEAFNVDPNGIDGSTCRIFLKVPIGGARAPQFPEMTQAMGVGNFSVEEGYVNVIDVFQFDGKVFFDCRYALIQGSQDLKQIFINMDGSYDIIEIDGGKQYEGVRNHIGGFGVSKTEAPRNMAVQFGFGTTFNGAVGIAAGDSLISPRIAIELNNGKVNVSTLNFTPNPAWSFAKNNFVQEGAVKIDRKYRAPEFPEDKGANELEIWIVGSNRGESSIGKVDLTGTPFESAPVKAFVSPFQGEDQRVTSLTGFGFLPD